MVDYNQSLSVSEAIGRLQSLEEEGLVWVEEPTRSAWAAARTEPRPPALHRVAWDSQSFGHSDKLSERSRLHLLHDVTAMDLDSFFRCTQFVRDLFVEYP